MLLQLGIQNFAIIEAWRTDFEPGETVITGETGSGKSIFVDALLFLTGARADRKLARDPGKRMRVDGLFSVDRRNRNLLDALAEADIPCDEETLLISRELDAKSSRILINDRMVTLAKLKEITEMIMDVHAQNAQSLLADSKQYINFLDESIGEPIAEKQRRLRELLKQDRDLAASLEALDLSPEAVARELELLDFQIDEIRSAQLKSIDEPALNAEYRRLTGATERYGETSKIAAALNGGTPVRDIIRRMAVTLDELYRKDSESEPIKDLVWQIDAELETLTDEVERYRDGIIIDPHRIDEIDAIFTMLQSLRRKYGSDIEAILKFYADAKARRTALTSIEQRRAALAHERERLAREIVELADDIHGDRAAAAQTFEQRIKSELVQMAIRKIDFKVELHRLKEVGARGYDRVEFMISTNPGEAMRPLNEVASGGEMSRFMLAFKIVTAQIRKLSTLVFDEIDTGISGRTAQVVAEKLFRLGTRHQVLVITHLPQIAAMADAHCEIRKHVEAGVTHSTIRRLEGDARIEEQARLIGGVNITSVTRRSATEMLAQAAQLRHLES